MLDVQKTPYWKTLQPVIESGAMQSAIDGEYRYPYRINIYPGTSGMFSCLFCQSNSCPKYNDTILSDHDYLSYS